MFEIATTAFGCPTPRVALQELPGPQATVAAAQLYTFFS
jgi:hypothetical protein